MTLREWNARLHGLVVFRALLEDPVVAKLVDLTDRMAAGASGMGLVCDAAAAFEAALFEHTPNWSDIFPTPFWNRRPSACGRRLPDSSPPFCRVRWTASWPFCRRCAV